MLQATQGGPSLAVAPLRARVRPAVPDVAANPLHAGAAASDRLLRPLRVLHPKGRCSTRPASLLKTQIPLRTHFWDVDRPGFFEAHTVAHRGNSMARDFLYSLTFTDICSGWTENRAVWGRGSRGVLDQVQDIASHIEFPVLGFDCDNGSVEYAIGVTDSGSTFVNPGKRRKHVS